VTVTLYEIHGDWADQFPLGTAQTMSDATIIARACVNRMTNPALGEWTIIIKDGQQEHVWQP
jgi:hypothetical protein